MKLRAPIPPRLVRRRPSQIYLPFVDGERLRLERRIKRIILTATGAALLALFGGTAVGRYASVWLALNAKLTAARTFGWEPSRADVDALWRARRAWGVRQTDARLRRTFAESDAAMQRLYRAAGMAPGEGLLRWANHDQTLLLSSAVFQPDDRRSYRFRPGVRAVWLKGTPHPRDPLGHFLVPDTPEVRAAAISAGATILEDSRQSTNSWGFRGPEPDLSAPVRGIVLGDSFMQGMLVADDETPSARLEAELSRVLKTRASVLNTGHFGYSPEQYYFTFLECLDRIHLQSSNLQFVVVSVCPNDFGAGLEVLSGRGDWSEGLHWIGRIRDLCRERRIAFVLAPVPCDAQVEGNRRDGRYPGPLAEFCDGDPASYCFAFEDFVEAHLGLGLGKPAGSRSPLYNRHLDDGHFSPKGAEVWGRSLARRVALLLEARAD